MGTLFQVSFCFFLAGAAGQAGSGILQNVDSALCGAGGESLKLPSRLLRSNISKLTTEGTHQIFYFDIIPSQVIVSFCGIKVWRGQTRVTQGSTSGVLIHLAGFREASVEFVP